MTAPAQPDPAGSGVEAEPAQPPGSPRRRSRLGRFLHALGTPFRWLPRPSIHTKRGILILVLLVASSAIALTVVGVVAVGWTETADFCGRCHTMEPELKAYAISPHREVPCAECHVEPGVAGWARSKINGMRQLVLLLTGSFETPIRTPDHGDLPPTSETCARCHSVDRLVANGGAVRLVLTARYREDEANTMDMIALVIRPSGFGGTTNIRGAHWHVESDVEYSSADRRAQQIDWVGVRRNGQFVQYILASAIVDPVNVQTDIDRLKDASPPRRMDCIDCHNRIGHGTPTIDQAIDAAITSGQVDQRLPFIKREASARLSASYASEADLDAAIAALGDFYDAQYPIVARTKAGRIDQAIRNLQTVARLVATPDMKVTASTYPNNLGHQASPGCFRCHDGAHYKVIDGRVTSDTIPAGCTTCHTYPQIGAVESGVVIGQRPQSHDDRLWVFDHKLSTVSVDPTTSVCGACHTATYCQNCHATQAAQVKHEEMVFNHAAVIRETGAAICAACHQPVYCAQCHAEPVLPDPFPPPADLEPSATLKPSP